MQEKLRQSRCRLNIPCSPLPANFQHRVLMQKPLLLALFIAASFACAEDAPKPDRFIANARQLIYEGKRSGEGYFSPDGGKLIFQSERDDANPFYQIYTLDFASGDTARVSPGVGKTTCSFFQPG